ncbi:MAG: DUF4347 domain-containing protein [Gammaproteobacteria bacterium]
MGFNRLRAVAPPAAKTAGRFTLETLEPRYLMSADVGGVLVAYHGLAGVQPAVIAAPLLDSGSALNLSGSAAVATTGTRHEVAIVDSAVKDSKQLVADMLNTASQNRRLDIYVIDGHQNGIGQISTILAGYRNLDAVHIISHSTDAELQLGDTLLTRANLNQYAQQIAGWRTSLGTQADLLLYGCDLAAHPDGKALVTALSTLTGAAVAASTDMTGNAVLGGDWNLEYATGPIETAAALSVQAQQNWMGLLATQTVIDQFNSISYNNNDGTASWAGPWQEIGEANGPSTGFVSVSTNLGINGLQAGLGASRAVNLSGAASATLSFDWSVLPPSTTGSATLDVYNGTTWTTVQTFDLSVGSPFASNSMDITPFISANTQIRFQISSVANNPATTLVIDNVQISYIPNTAPTITGTVGSQTVTDKTTVKPFSAVTIGDVDSPAQTLTVSVNLDAAAKGNLSNLSGFIAGPAGSYTFTGTAAAATAALQNLLFIPTANRVAPGSAETTTFILTANDGIAAPVTDSITTVVSTSINDAPTITGTASGQSVTDKTTVKPFSTVTIGDVDSPAQTLTVSVNLDAAAKGSLSNLSGFIAGPAGSYTFTGTAAAATAALQNLLFIPTANRVAPGSAETTTFILTANDGIAAPVTDSITTILSTSINDAPVIGAQGFVINDNVPDGSTATTLTSTDPDRGDTRTYAITGGNAATAFAIDPVTGKVSVTDGRVLRANSAPTMTLVVTVTDAQGLSATGGVTVTVKSLSKINDTITPTAPMPAPPIIETAPSPPPSGSPVANGNNNHAMTGPGGHPHGGYVIAGTRAVQTKSGSGPPPPPVVFTENARTMINSDKNDNVMSAMQAPISLRSAGAGVLSSLISNASFTRELNNLRDETRHDITITKMTAGVSIVTTTGLSVGYVAWLARGGALLTSVLSSLPAWRIIDPLPILAFSHKHVEEEDDSLESMVRKGNEHVNPTDEASKPSDKDVRITPGEL